VNGKYRVRINERSGVHTYLKSWGTSDPVERIKFGELADGPIGVGKPKSAAVYPRAEAEAVAHKWAEWLTANDLAPIAARIRIVPATGGMESTWRVQ
jgi:hypothetical protein